MEGEEEWEELCYHQHIEEERGEKSSREKIRMRWITIKLGRRTEESVVGVGEGRGGRVEGKDE